jgi:glucokinase
MERKYDVFLSYASEDSPLVEDVRARLAAAGFRVFLDKVELLGGENIVSRIFESIAGCRYFAIFLTSRSVRSNWVTHELSTAVIEQLENRTIILPLLYEDCPIPEVLRAIHYIDFRQSFQRGIKDLENAMGIRGKLSGPLLGEIKEKLTGDIDETQDLYLAVDVGGTKVYVSLMNDSAERLFDKKFNTEGHGDKEQLYQKLKSYILIAIQEIAESVDMEFGDIKKRLRAISLAFPGPTDSDSGVVLNAPNLRVTDLRLGERLKADLRIDTFVDNDVNLGVLGEAWIGVAKHCENVVGIIIGTGIGGGIIINGRILRGSTQSAGEVGHMVVDIESRHTCGCGQRGCLEALASRKSIARDIRNRKLEIGDEDIKWEEQNLGSTKLVGHYLNGDPETIEVVDQAMAACGKAVFSLLNCFNPELVFLSGGFVRQFVEAGREDVVLRPVEREVAKCMPAVKGQEPNAVQIKVGSLDNAMLVGACRIASESNIGLASYDIQEVLSILTRDLTDSQRRVLQSLSRAPNKVDADPRSNFHKAHLKLLRDRGLIETPNGGGLRTGMDIHISAIGRIVVNAGSGKVASP